MATIWLFLGAALGIGCGLLFLVAKRRASMAWGFGAVIASFLLISAAILAVRMLARDSMVPFGVLTVLSFLATAAAVLICEDGNRL